MVDIAFSPPLKALSEVRPNITGDRTITTRFVATLSAIEWRRLKQQGAVIELWTNLPIEGNEGGNWSGVAFEEDKAAQVQVRPNLKMPSQWAETYLEHRKEWCNSLRFYIFNISFTTPLSQNTLTRTESTIMEPACSGSEPTPPMGQ